MEADANVPGPDQFSINGTAGAAADLPGIPGQDVHTVHIRNGTVRGFKGGINLYFSAPAAELVPAAP
jgi:hypothetical protein